MRKMKAITTRNSKLQLYERDDSLGRSKNQDSTDALRRSSLVVMQHSHSPQQTGKRYTYHPSKPAQQSELVGEFIPKEARKSMIDDVRSAHF